MAWSTSVGTVQISISAHLGTLFSPHSIDQPLHCKLTHRQPTASQC